MESQDNNLNPNEALSSISEAKHQTAKMSEAPAGYYATLGFAVALLIISPITHMAITFTLIAVACALLAIAVSRYAKKVPTWSFGKLFHPTAWAFWTMTILAFIGIFGSSIAGNVPFAIAAAIVVFIAWAALGPVWDRAYRKQMESEDL